MCHIMHMTGDGFRKLIYTCKTNKSIQVGKASYINMYESKLFTQLANTLYIVVPSSQITCTTKMFQINIIAC